MRTQVTSTVMISLLAAATSHAQTWQDNLLARQLEDANSGVFQVFPSLKMISLALLMMAGVLWLFYFRSAWQHLQERDSRRLILHLPRRGDIPSLQISGHPEGMRVISREPGRSDHQRGTRLHAARFDKKSRSNGDYTPLKGD